MARFNRSRYVNLDVLIDEGGKRHLPLRKLIDLSYQTDDLMLTVGKGENLPMIAGLVWGEGCENLWWVIADINEIRNPFDLEIGTKIRVPGLVRVISAVYDINKK